MHPSGYTKFKLHLDEEKGRGKERKSDFFPQFSKRSMKFIEFKF